MDYWKKLKSIRGNESTVSWQKGLKHIEEYIEWINSCKMLVTNDSLGLHIVEVLGKKTVALFGPTLESEVFVRTGRKLPPNQTMIAYLVWTPGGFKNALYASHNA